jgi:hypothetical protein
MIQQSQATVNETGISHRQLCPGLALPCSTFQRWRARIHEGRAPREQPGSKKIAPLPLAELREQISRLPHRRRRTAGTTALYQAHRDHISRRHLNTLVSQARSHHHRACRAQWLNLTWHGPNVAWALDGAECLPDEAGQKLLLVGWQDLASSFQFEPLVSLQQTAVMVTDRLSQMFLRHGVPLFLKRDNGSLFNDATLDALLAEFGVIPLNSPRAYPRYNGAMERGIHDLKQSLGRVLPAPARWEVAQALPVIRTALDRQNLLSRPRLDGRSALEFFQRQPASRWSRRQRQEFFVWIQSHAEGKMQTMRTVDQQSFQRAWRDAALTWLRCQGLVTVSKDKSVTPFFSQIVS